MLVDPFNRSITYLRLSATDRCDFRCVYCMAEEMTFLPREQILSIEEMTLIGQAFVELGVKKIRVTGGEPLVRRNIHQLFDNLGALPALEELTLTSNGSQLSHSAERLNAAGVKRINISLDSLQAERFTDITRTGKLSQVLAGIDAAIAAGMQVKLNSVILKHRNLDEVLPLVEFAFEKGIDISFIEEMPLGVIDDHQRDLEFVSSAALRNIIEATYPLSEAPLTGNTTGGPSRYWQHSNYPGSRIGFISPHSNNFCGDCNRVRVTAEGKLLLCLGNEHSADLREIVRTHPGDINALKEGILEAITRKPERHEFVLDDKPQIVRFMNMTGG